MRRPHGQSTKLRQMLRHLPLRTESHTQIPFDSRHHPEVRAHCGPKDLGIARRPKETIYLQTLAQVSATNGSSL